MQRKQLVFALSIALIIPCMNMNAMNQKKSTPAREANKAAILNKYTAPELLKPAANTPNPEPESSPTLAPAPEASPAPEILQEEAVVQQSAVTARTEPIAQEAVSIPESAPIIEALQIKETKPELPIANIAAAALSFLDHPTLQRIAQEDPASLIKISWMRPVEKREVAVVSALSNTNIAAVKEVLNSGDLVKVINHHLGVFIEKFKSARPTDSQSLKELLVIGLAEMRSAGNILKLCDDYPKKREAKINELNNIIAKVPENQKQKASEELSAIKQFTIARPQDETLMLALHAFSALRFLQLKQLELSMKKGFDELREIQSKIDLTYNMMPDEVKKSLPENLVVHKEHNDDYIYDLTMKK